MGQAPKGSTYNDKEIGIALIAGAADLGPMTPKPKKWTNAPTKIGKQGDIILCVRATIGDLNWADKEYCYGRGVAGIRVNGQFDPEFIWFWLKACKEHLLSLGRGATFKQISKTDIASLPVPDLNIAEQRRIVTRIKECMERVEEIEGLRAEAIEESDALVQSVLHDTWRSDEIASAEKMALDELGQITTGNTPSRKKPEFFGGSQPWVTPGDFNGRLIATGRECLSKKGIAEGRARVVPEGSVLVVCIGATIGKVALAVRDLGINQQINAVTFDKEKVLPEYGYWACRALVPEIIGNASKNTLPILNKGKFSKLQIPVPSLYIQGQVSSKLDAVEVAVSEMRRDLSESNIASTALRESILRKAFAGEL